MNNISTLFIKALEDKNLLQLSKLPKADLHNHFCLGGNRDYIYQKTGKMVPVLDHTLKSMEEMHQWVEHHIDNLLDSIEGRQLALEACFQQARDDSIAILEVGEDVWANGHFYDNNVLKLIKAFQDVHQKIAPNIEFRFQIGLSRHCPVNLLQAWAEPFFEHDCFCSIDLYGDELAQPISNLKPVYRRAKENGLVLKAHAGEWGDADSVKEAVEELELNEVQHGISAAESESVMYWLADHNIRLNICPASNVQLGRVENISTHPIRKLFDHGVQVTVNSDDILVFGSSVSQEYLSLYENGLFSAAELDQIRLNGLT